MTLDDPDFFPTPRAAVAPLLAALPAASWFVEPCAGNGALIEALEAAGHVCAFACDTNPRGPGIRRLDARRAPPGLPVITNPPFSQEKLVPLLEHWAGVAPTWLLLPIERLTNDYMQPFVGHVDRIAPIGRVRWFEGSPHKSTKSFAWVRFGVDRSGLFVPRESR